MTKFISDQNKPESKDLQASQIHQNRQYQQIWQNHQTKQNHQISQNPQIHQLGSTPARHRGEEEQLETRNLFQRLSLLLMRGNAALLVNRVPEGDTLEGAIDGQE